jgi:hypothetical protein
MAERSRGVWRLGTRLTCGAKLSVAGREGGESWASATKRAERTEGPSGERRKADGLLASWAGKREKDRLCWVRKGVGERGFWGLNFFMNLRPHFIKHKPCKANYDTQTLIVLKLFKF